MNTNYANNIFEYSNRSYTCIASLYTKNNNQDIDQRMTCDMAGIDEIVYENELNGLLVSGYIIYTDRYASVDKLINSQYCYCDFLFALNKNKVDASAKEIAVDIENKFSHTFIVNSINVIQRAEQVIKYKISIVSINWFNCAAKVQYSNYGDAPQQIFDIIKDCISNNDLIIDKTTFDTVKTNVKLSYISQLNDNLFTVMQYLLHKLYYDYATKDDSLKFLVYDQFNNAYRLLDIKQKSTALGFYSTILSFFKTNAEVIIQQEPTNMGSFINSAMKTDVYSSLYNINMFQYFHRDNSISCFSTPSDAITNYLNTSLDITNYNKKYQPFDQNLSKKYTSYGSYWNNNINSYNKLTYALMENNSLILNITGEVLRQPGTYNVITIDRSLKNMIGDSSSELNELKRKYKNFEGIWMAFKVRTIIQPNIPSFRQQVALFRNFVPLLNDGN